MARGNYHLRLDSATNSLIENYARRLGIRELEVIRELIMRGIEVVSESEEADDYLKLIGYLAQLKYYARKLDELERCRKSYLRDHLKAYRYENIDPKKLKKLKREKKLIERDRGIRDTLTAIRSLQDYFLRKYEKLVREKIIPLLKKLGIYEDIEKTYEEVRDLQKEIEQEELKRLEEELKKQKLSITH